MNEIDFKKIQEEINQAATLEDGSALDEIYNHLLDIRTSPDVVLEEHDVQQILGLQIQILYWRSLAVDRKIDGTMVRPPGA